MNSRWWMSTNILLETAAYFLFIELLFNLTLRWIKDGYPWFNKAKVCNSAKLSVHNLTRSTATTGTGA